MDRQQRVSHPTITPSLVVNIGPDLTLQNLVIADKSEYVFNAFYYMH